MSTGWRGCGVVACSRDVGLCGALGKVCVSQPSLVPLYPETLVGTGQ